MKNRSTLTLPEKAAKYLTKQSFGNRQLEYKEGSQISAAIVIPALSEYENIRLLMESFLLNDHLLFVNTLIIFVVNNTASVTDEIKQDNFQTIKFLRGLISGNTANDELANKIISSGLRVALVDASTPGNELPEKEGGVGLARKIGMDLALTVFVQNEVNKLIVCLDSDCTISTNYLTEVHKLTHDPDFSAGYFNYEHPLDSGRTIKAIICYEIFLHYYVAALKTASSPYAFHTIGSTIICTAEEYIKTGGMNKRKAAEDFYFLEKLSKNCKIKQIMTATVYPSPRVSFRVPFGTGQRVSRFISQVQDEYLLYSIKSFYVLEEWLKVFNNAEILKADEYLKKANNINSNLHEFLIRNNFKLEWQSILANSKQPEQIQKQKVLWFDGFRTLKLIHYLRDTQYPLEPMFSSLDALFEDMNVAEKIERDKDIPDLLMQKKYLEILRTLSR